MNLEDLANTQPAWDRTIRAVDQWLGDNKLIPINFRGDLLSPPDIKRDEWITELLLIASHALAEPEA